MSRQFFDTNTDIDSEAQTERRRNFIGRMERKLERKESSADNQPQGSRFLVS